MRGQYEMTARRAPALAVTFGERRTVFGDSMRMMPVIHPRRLSRRMQDERRMIPRATNR